MGKQYKSGCSHSRDYEVVLDTGHRADWEGGGCNNQRLCGGLEEQPCDQQSVGRNGAGEHLEQDTEAALPHCPATCAPG